jgi:hypothetical protein
VIGDWDLRFEVEIWDWDLKSGFEIIWDGDLQLRFLIEISDFTVDGFEIESRGWDWDSRFKIWD